ncbi:troponin T, cardiac muscle-like [Hippoglossus stenolepis]|uniref:troponin T, cardiac muscle-like n=1 Tax=Hippoglossus stenolepis TaxID=195615 RepID=UPI001FAF14EB|nr:troponin T, cardiac muscle-like [Hippoglossus stenolepis]
MAHSGITTGQVKPQHKCRDCRAFKRDVNYLEHLLGKERARCRQNREWRLTLCQALDEAHAQLAKLQPPKESYCDTDKEIWQPEDWEEEGDWDEEAQQPEDCEEEGDWDEEAQQPEDFEEEGDWAEEPQQPEETTKQNQETDLHTYYKELQEPNIIIQQKFALELQVERRKNEALLDELQKLRASNNEIIQSNEADNLTARQQATHLKAEIEKVFKSQMRTFEAEQNLLHLQVMEEMRCLRKSAAEEKVLLQRQVEELTSQLSLKKEKPVETEASEETPKKKKSSIWKRIRQTLGLRRRKKKQKDAAPHN